MLFPSCIMAYPFIVCGKGAAQYGKLFPHFKNCIARTILLESSARMRYNTTVCNNSKEICKG